MVILSMCSVAGLLFLFFLMVRSPSRSTLFPYTTLFRSVFASRAGVRLRREVSRSKSSGVTSRPRAVRGLDVTPDDLDRKSTRLNSSHLGISYAVFCLKKKKNNHQRTQTYHNVASTTTAR